MNDDDMLLGGGFDRPSELRLIQKQLAIAASAGTELEQSIHLTKISVQFTKQ